MGFQKRLTDGDCEVIKKAGERVSPHAVINETSRVYVSSGSPAFLDVTLAPPYAIRGRDVGVEMVWSLI